MTRKSDQVPINPGIRVRENRGGHGVTVAAAFPVPIDELSFDGTAEFGSYALQHYTGAVNVPVSDTVALRIAGDRFSR
jgi:iron complex outermembrane receptor protein